MDTLYITLILEKILKSDLMVFCSCHSPRPSLFSSSSGYDDYRGFLNLCVVLLVSS